MSNHVTEWLNAYLDGELKGVRLHQVEQHLAGCETCQAELDSLQGLSAMLRSDPAPEFPSAERLVSNVNLLLPSKRSAAPRRQLLEVGWWMIPVGLLMAWVFFSTAILLEDVVAVADRLGLLDTSSALMVSEPSETAYWSSTLGEFGVLQGESLDWAESTESFTRSVLPQFNIQVSIALLYLTWIALWWARRMRQGLVPLLEG